jgi:putative membrane protein (TIGR04086 family)
MMREGNSVAKYTGRARFNARPPQEPGMMLCVIKGVFTGLFITLVCAACLSLIGLVTEDIFIDAYMQYLMVAITLMSIFIGSLFAAKCASSKGLIVGGLVGIVYVLLAAGIGMHLGHETLSLLIVANKLAAGVAAGMLGGLIGVNL